MSRCRLARRVSRLLAAMSCSGLIFTLHVVAATPTGKARPSPAAEIAALDGAMPRSFDTFPGDPCAGTWDVRSPDGAVIGKITVLRYRGAPFAHLSGPDALPFNEPVSRLDPHSIRLPDRGMSAVMRCTGTRAVQLTVDEISRGWAKIRRTNGSPRYQPPQIKTQANQRRAKLAAARVASLARRSQKNDSSDVDGAPAQFEARATCRGS